MTMTSQGARRLRMPAAIGAAAVAAALVALPTAPAAADPVGHPPVAAADGFTAVRGHEKEVAAPGVLANDTDADGDDLTASIVTGASNGTLSLRADGSFTYTSAPGFTGTDSFAYRAFDGTELSDTVIVSIAVHSEEEAFVAAIYRDFLGRAPDPGGLAFWSHRLETGYESRGFFVHRMSRSHEYGVKVVNRMYLDVLGRSVDPSGREFWARRIQKGMLPSQLLMQLIGSNEFLTKAGGTVGGYVDRLYAGILGRAPSGSERAADVARIEAGTLRQRVASDLYRTVESRSRRVTVQYDDLLDRAPTAEELEAGVAKLGSGYDDVRFAVFLASSTEYVDAAIAAG